MSLEGKVALVTGAAGKASIGYGIARALVKKGAAVLINDFAKPVELEERAQELRALGGQVATFSADVTRRSDVDAMLSALVRHFGRLDIQISNAGMMGKQHLSAITLEDAERIVRVNLKGSFNVCQAAARQMIAQKEGGRIIVISSVHSEMSFGLTAAYGASKRGLWSLVQSMAVELARYDITVNQVEPGWVPTGFDGIRPGQLSESDLEARLNSIPLGQPVLPADIAGAVLYFAGPAAALVSGAALRVDGGQIAGKF